MTNKSKSKVEKTRVYLDYTCFTCGQKLSSANTTINHCHTMHGYILPSRKVGQSRPQNGQYEYIRDKDKEVDEFHYACPSCWFHCPESEETVDKETVDEETVDEALVVLNDHTREEHHPQKTTNTRPLVKGSGSTSTPGSSRSRASSISSQNIQSDDGDSKDEDEEEQGSGGSGTPENGYRSSAVDDQIESINRLSAKLDELINLFKRIVNDNS